MIPVQPLRRRAARRGNAATILVIVLALACVAVIAGYAYLRHQERVQTRQQVVALLAKADQARDKGIFEEARAAAEEAEAVLKEQGTVFEAAALQGHRQAIAAHKEAAEQFALATELAEKAKTNFPEALAGFAELIAALPENEALGAAVQRLLATAVLERAEALRAEATANFAQSMRGLDKLIDTPVLDEDEPLLMRLKTVRVQVVLERAMAQGVKSNDPVAGYKLLLRMQDEQAKALEAAGAMPEMKDAIEKAAGRAKTAIVDGVAASLTEALATAKAGKVDRALEAVAAEGRRLANLPEALRGETPQAYAELVAGLKGAAGSGKDPKLPAALPIPEATAKGLTQLYALEAARETTATIDTAQPKALARLREAKEALAQAAPDLPEAVATESKRVDRAIARAEKARTEAKAAKEKAAKAKAGKKPDVERQAEIENALRPHFPRIMGFARAAAMSLKNAQPKARALTEEGMVFTYDVGGVEARLIFGPENVPDTLVARAEGFTFSYPWTPFFYLPLGWSAKLGPAMAEAKVAPGDKPWRLLEMPGGIGAMQTGEGGDFLFFDGALHKLRALREDDAEALEAYKQAAAALLKAVEADESIPAPMRKALAPVIRGTWEPLDPRDYLSGPYCRRIIAQNYLERHLPEMSKPVTDALNAFRAALENVREAGPVYTFTTKEGATWTALRPLSTALGQRSGPADDQSGGGPIKPPPYQWRWVDKAGDTAFARAVPERFLSTMWVVNLYKGKHDLPPLDQAPLVVKMLHTAAGELASWKPGDEKAKGDPKAWAEALKTDTGVFLRGEWGEPGWGFPLHVPYYDGGGAPTALAVADGVLKSPDFAAIEDPEARRKAQDAYLDEIAKTLKTPGELGLFYMVLARYTLDSPIPGKDTLVGSHKGSGDFHQTVYQLLDRKIGDYFVGDCDDMAEFFQVTTERQGKNSQVLSLPGHAAAAYVEKADPGKGEGSEYRLVLLQSGPTMLFRGTTLDEVVERTMQEFNKEQQAHYTVASFPFLFRFANEQTRTTYLLSNRILVDPEYAEVMIRVQSYWHYHYYSTAVREMIELLKTDKDISNYHELGSLYDMVALYQEALEMREKELTIAGERDESVLLNTLASIAQAHEAMDEDEKALAVVERMRKRMEKLRTTRQIDVYRRTIGKRLEMARFLVGLHQPVRAYKMIEHDINALFRDDSLPFPFVATLVSIYAELRDMEEKGQTLTKKQTRLRDMVDQRILSTIFAKGLFKDDDDFNQVIRNYSILGRYAIAKVGREKGIAKLLADGPYPAGPKDHHERQPGISEEDWAWFRVVPAIHAGYVRMYVNHREEEDYDPPKALPLVDGMRRAFAEAEKANLGSLVLLQGDMVEAEIIEAMIQKDKDKFDKIFAKVRERDWSHLYSEAATAFGLFSGLVPLEAFPAWMEVFHKHIPGKQHYFKVAYRALNNRYYDHALAAGVASASFFPELKAMQQEAEYMKKTIAIVKERAKAREEAKEKAAAEAKEKTADADEDAGEPDAEPEADDDAGEAEAEPTARRPLPSPACAARAA